MKKNSEYHLLIIWKNAIKFDKKIYDDLKKKFEIRNKFKIIWNDVNCSNNLSRFYGTKLSDKSFKEEHCGKEYFYVYILEDCQPKYDFRETSHGKEYVNVNMFDSKMMYRQWTGGGHKIHATDNKNEFNHDITLLFGKNKEDFVKTYSPNTKCVTINRDLIGCDGWNSIEEVLYVMNNCIDYVILRDYDDDFQSMYTVDNYDIDALCDSKENAKWIINGKEIYVDNHIQYKIKIANCNCLFDFKSIDDGYYCESLSKDILETKVEHHGYYIPNREYAYHACLYHALIHKFNFETEYNERLGNVFYEIHDKSKSKNHYIKVIEDWMLNHGYYITIQKENPFKMNSENLSLFSEGLLKEDFYKELNLRVQAKKYESILEETKEEVENLNNKISHYESENLELNNRIKDLNDKYEKVIFSKGWIFLEKLRKIRNKWLRRR